ncbi:hypothetical protein WDW86_19285, partial [Bdellovibrionota bacterium FG-2]
HRTASGLGVVIRSMGIIWGLDDHVLETAAFRYRLIADAIDAGGELARSTLNRHLDFAGLSRRRLNTLGKKTFLNLPVQRASALANQGFHYTLNRSIFPGQTRRELLWYGGPITVDGGSGSIVSKYSDGTAAIMDSLGMTDPDGADYELAWEIMKAGLLRQPLPAFP